jgi:simple sugar transport system ATP-binding protein
MATGTDGATAAGEAVSALRVCEVSKRFGTVQANDAVSCEVAAGSIHALVGENGAGKTTLMRVVYGLYTPDSGHVELFGVPVSFSSPREALAWGVGMVHQHSLLLTSLTVAENVLLSTSGLGRPPRQQTIARLRQLSEENHLRVDPTVTVGKLSVGGRQRAEILSALFHGARLLILDEPTTVLTPQEVDDLFVVLRRLRGGGTTIVLVTHKLAEVMAIADRVTVLRGGKMVDTVSTDATNERSLVHMMVGRDVPLHVGDESPRASSAQSVLRVDGVTVRDAEGVTRVRNVSFEVAAGEIVAITGVEGNGQIPLTEALVGLQPITAGNLFFRGQRITGWSIERRRKRGIAYIPESRMTEGIDPLISVRDNLILGRHNRRPYARFGLRNMRLTKRFARRLVDEYNVVAPSVDSNASTLSGGNLQKVVVAREVSHDPELLIAVQPTQGVDVAATHQIRSTLLRLREKGSAIILVSSDLSEVCDLADCTIVLYNGQVAGQLRRPHLSEEAIGVYAMGLKG